MGYSSNCCSSLRSALSNRIELIILGHGETFKVTDVNHFDIKTDVQQCAKKPYLLKQYLETFKSRFKQNDIIIFNDGSDVLYSTSSKEVESQFEKMEKNNTVIFSTERNCFPTPCRQPDSNVKPRSKYLNAGGWIARYDVAVKFLSVWIQTMEFDKVVSRDDQKTLQSYLLGNYDHIKIDLDYNCSIFQSAFYTRLAENNWNVSDPNGPYVTKNGIIKNLETNSTPHLIHFNGDKKTLVEIEQYIWHVRSKKTGFDAEFLASCNTYRSVYPQIENCKRIKKSCDKVRQKILLVA